MSANRCESEFASDTKSSNFDAESFRQEVRSFCANDIPANIQQKISKNQYFSKEERVQWQKLLQRKGWFTGDWPEQFGGQGWGPLQRFIWIEELERAGTPWLTYFGVGFVGPVIYTFGDEDQQERYLDGIRHSETWWCQGFSEPGAGSDLASIKTRASLEGDHYVVTGQKTWTTMAQWADMMFCLVRTHEGSQRQQGITFLLIDLNSPGVTVRPIETIDGCHNVNEVFLDKVKVPVRNRIGNEGDGWTITKFIVGRERLLVTELGKARRLLDELVSLASHIKDGSSPVINSNALRLRLAELEVKYRVLRDTAYAAVEGMESGKDSSASASLLKIRGSELQQSILDTTLEVMAQQGLAFQKDAIHGDFDGYLHGSAETPGTIYEHMHCRATSIYGGSNEIQRGIIAKAGLGL